jgi:hypothetical protein
LSSSSSFREPVCVLAGRRQSRKNEALAKGEALHARHIRTAV